MTLGTGQGKKRRVLRKAYCWLSGLAPRNSLKPINRLFCSSEWWQVTKKWDQGTRRGRRGPTSSLHPMQISLYCLCWHSPRGWHKGSAKDIKYKLKKNYVKIKRCDKLNETIHPSQSIFSLSRIKTRHNKLEWVIHTCLHTLVSSDIFIHINYAQNASRS